MLIKDYSLNVNFLFFSITLFLILLIPWNPPSWSWLSDPWDYLEQSQRSFFDKDLYAPHISPGFFPRPFTVPLFYKVANSNPDIIIQIQKLIYVFSIFFLVNSLLLFVKTISKKGGHYKLPLFNSIAARVLPNPEYTRWFVNHGLPNVKKLKKDLVGFDGGKNKDKLYKLYNDSTNQAFFDWITTKGRTSYIHFLITHPSYALLLDENKEHLQRIFAYNLTFTGPAKGYSYLVQNIFPLFSWYMTLILAIILIILFFKHKRQVFLFPPLILIIFVFHVLVSYNGDAMEVDRHLITTNIVVQFLGFFSLVLIFDSINYRSLLLLLRRVFPFPK